MMLHNSKLVRYSETIIKQLSFTNLKYKNRFRDKWVKLGYADEILRLSGRKCIFLIFYNNDAPIKTALMLSF